MAFSRNAYMRVWMQARRARWRMAGCCPDCGQPTRRYIYCVAHRDKSSRTRMSCLDCAAERLLGRKRCAHCLEVHRVRVATWRAGKALVLKHA